MRQLLQLNQIERDLLRRDIFIAVQNKLLAAIQRNALFAESVRSGDNSAQQAITDEVQCAVVYLIENVFELKDASIPGQNVGNVVPQRDGVRVSATALPLAGLQLEIAASSAANVKQQVGGQHYRQAAVQHWDFAAHQKMDYFQGQITKYLTRWKMKNGLEDLKKAQHFLEKYMEVWAEFAPCTCAETDGKKCMIPLHQPAK